MLTAEYLLEVRDRLNTTENLEVEEEGDIFTLDDICMNSLGPYKYPCYRMTVLDCFFEGGYNWDSTAKASLASRGKGRASHV
jgi:hypothetical protein